MEKNEEKMKTEKGRFASRVFPKLLIWSTTGLHTSKRHLLTYVTGM